MIITMEPGAPREQVEQVEKLIEESGYQVHPIYGTNLTVLAAVGDERDKPGVAERLRSQPGVLKVELILPPYKLVSLSPGPGVVRPRTVVEIEVSWQGGASKVSIGDGGFMVMAGPCSVESLEQITATARMAKEGGASMLRGGAFKPRTSPYSFQGLEEEGLKYLAAARHETGLPIVTELMDQHHIELLDKYADMIQIGARNMQNFTLLKALGQTKKPVLLKRGMSSKIDEWLMSAEYILAQGNPNVILCERGIRTFETAYRNVLDLNAVPKLRGLTHLPILVDPSHGTGAWKLVTPMAKAAVACGADGLIVEIHPEPSKAFSDGDQSLKQRNFLTMMNEVATVAEAVGMTPVWRKPRA